MKKFLFFIALLFLPATASALTCGDSGSCIVTLINYKYAFDSAGYTSSYAPTSAWNTSDCSNHSAISTGVTPSGTPLYSFMSLKAYWNGTSWTTISTASYVQSSPTDLNLWKNATYANEVTGTLTLPTPAVLYPNGCSDIDPCGNALNDLETACSGSENVSTFDPETCTGYCKTCDEKYAEAAASCNPAPVKSFDCTGNTDSSGNYTSLEYTAPVCEDNGCAGAEAECSALHNGFYKFTCQENGAGYVTSSDCQPDACAAAKQAFADNNCHGIAHLKSYDCASHTGTCDDQINCADLQNDCQSSCKNQVQSFTCNPADLSSTCTCVSAPSISHDPPTPDEHGTPQATPDTSTETDTDHDLLKKIVDNLAKTTDNTAITAKTNDDELNSLNDTAEKIEEHTAKIATDQEQQAKDDILSGNESQSIISKVSDQVTGFIDSSVQDSKDHITNFQTTAPMPESLFDSTFSEISSVLDSGQCTDLVYPFHVLGQEKQFTLSCEFSDKIKTVLSFLVTVYTIMMMIDILYSGIVPKGSPQMKLWG